MRQVPPLRQVQQEHLQLNLLGLRLFLRQALQPVSQQELHLQKQFRQPVPLILLQLHQILQQPFLQEQLFSLRVFWRVLPSLQEQLFLPGSFLQLPF